jgi:hypothetical protein
VAKGEALAELETSSRNLEQQLKVAERETAELENELKRLDESFNARLAEFNLNVDNAGPESSSKPPTTEQPGLTEIPATGESVAVLKSGAAAQGPIASSTEIVETVAEATGTEPRPVVPASRPLRGVANVISLAARLRGQHKAPQG